MDRLSKVIIAIVSIIAAIGIYIISHSGFYLFNYHDGATPAQRMEMRR